MPTRNVPRLMMSSSREGEEACCALAEVTVSSSAAATISQPGLDLATPDQTRLRNIGLRNILGTSSTLPFSAAHGRRRTLLRSLAHVPAKGNPVRKGEPL